MSLKKRDTVKSLAAEIRARWPELDVRVERGHYSTDRKIGRLRRAGKGRWGSRILVYSKTHLLLDHNNAEGYRRASDVREWVEKYAAGEAKPMREKRAFEAL